MVNLRSLAQVAYTAYSASAEDCGDIFSFLALQEIAPPQNSMACPPNGRGTCPQEESENGLMRCFIALQ